MIIALLGAESTGKTQLAGQLTTHCRSQGLRATAVPEYLREWCDTHARTPQLHDQTHIANTQAERIELAATQHDIVFADTTPLMTAIYSEHVFGDTSLIRSALQFQSRCALTLLTGLDIPWVADGLQRDGPHVRTPVDTRLRELFAQAALPYQVVYGLGTQRLQAALRILDATKLIAACADSTRASGLKDSKNEASTPWVWVCDKCSDPDCEHRLFSRLQTKRST
jgi:nicotinamide riboside kinase